MIDSYRIDDIAGDLKNKETLSNFKKIVNSARQLEKAINEDRGLETNIEKSDKLLSSYQKKREAKIISDDLYVAYELQALIFVANGKGDAEFSLKEARSLKKPGWEFASNLANEWELNQIEIERRENTQKLNDEYKKRNTNIITRVAVISGLIIFVVIIALWSKISADILIHSANPTLVKITQDAGMSRQGEIMFLRTHPQLDSTSQFSQDCSTASANNNGESVLGCYVPSTNRIYLLTMPSSLYEEEVSTAAYELLHPIYISLDGSDATSLNNAIETDYSAALANPSYCTDSIGGQVSLFAKIEPTARDNELFSLLNTECNNSSNLANYISPYFTNIAADVSDNQQIDNLFEGDQTQLNQYQSTINQDMSYASTAYADSVSWADAGNQYEDNYNYNIYSQDIDNANNTINEYNALLAQVNTLVTAITGGQPVSQIQTIQSQSSQ